METSTMTVGQIRRRLDELAALILDQDFDNNGNPCDREYSKKLHDEEEMLFNKLEDM